MQEIGLFCEMQGSLKNYKESRKRDRINESRLAAIFNWAWILRTSCFLIPGTYHARSIFRKRPRYPPVHPGCRFYRHQIYKRWWRL